MEKKNIAIIMLSIALLGSGVCNIILGGFLGLIQSTPPPPKQEVIVAASETIQNLDPAYSYDIADSAVIDNVCETLYVINWSDSSFPIVPLLATTLPTISSDGLEYTISLRQGVYFHDGTLFNAYIAKWTFDRYNYFINWSGNSFYPDGYIAGGYSFPFNTSLPTTVLPTQSRILYKTATGLPLINRTEVLAPYVLKIVLNEKKGLLILFYASLDCQCYHLIMPQQIDIIITTRS